MMASYAKDAEWLAPVQERDARGEVEDDGRCKCNLQPVSVYDEAFICVYHRWHMHVHVGHTESPDHISGRTCQNQQQVLYRASGPVCPHACM